MPAIVVRDRFCRTAKIGRSRVVVFQPNDFRLAFGNRPFKCGNHGTAIRVIRRQYRITIKPFFNRIIDDGVHLLLRHETQNENPIPRDFMRVRKGDNGNTRARRYGTHGPDGTRQERPENEIDAGAHRFLCRGSGPGFRAFRIERINDEIFIGEVEHRYLRRIQQFAAQQFTASTQR